MFPCYNQPSWWQHYNIGPVTPCDTLLGLFLQNTINCRLQWQLWIEHVNTMKQSFKPSFDFFTFQGMGFLGEHQLWILKDYVIQYVLVWFGSWILGQNLEHCEFIILWRETRSSFTFSYSEWFLLYFFCTFVLDTV